MDPHKLRILIADDHTILRSGLKRLLQDVPGIQEVGEAENANVARHLLRSGNWDIVLLDLDMPGQNPLDVLKGLKVDHPEVAVLILSMYPEEQFGLRALKAGAAGYLNKDSAAEELISAIRRISEGGAYISAGLAGVIARNLHTGAVDEQQTHLSDREFAVLRGIAAGKSIVHIANELNLSAKTISTYRARVLSRLGLHSNVELARYAAEHGIVK
jgi:two-component system, NarL family, invasion response regulator UvrY